MPKFTRFEWEMGIAEFLCRIKKMTNTLSIADLVLVCLSLILPSDGDVGVLAIRIFEFLYNLRNEKTPSTPEDEKDDNVLIEKLLHFL